MQSLHSGLVKYLLLLREFANQLIYAQVVFQFFQATYFELKLL